MKILIFGDIYGKLGRKMLAEHIPHLRAHYQPDIVMVNDENISHGKGPRMNQIRWLEDQGVDIFTGGNHSLESREDIRDYMDTTDSRQLRPENLQGENLPGSGQRIYTFGDKKLLVINLLGTTFMSARKETIQNPFQTVDAVLEAYKNTRLDGIIVDFHKETTSEGYAMANYLDGRVSVLFGTHTHIQSNDAEIWPKGMGFINDIGFSGSRRSVIGVTWESIAHRFIEDRAEGLMVPDEKGPGVLSGMYVEINERICQHIEPIRIREGGN